jgi:hypothetical protein
MRILVHDYAGHPFQVQLSRALARSGHSVLHLHFASFQTPKGAVERRSDDPDNFAIEGLTLGRPFAKYNLSSCKRRCSSGVAQARAGNLFHPLYLKATGYHDAITTHT